MAASLRLAWQDEVRFSSDGDEFIVAGAETRVVFRPRVPEIRTAMELLAPPGEDEDFLVDSILATGTADALACWYYHIDQLRQRGLIRRTLQANGKPLATLIPLCRDVRKQVRPKSTLSTTDGSGSARRPKKNSAIHQDTYVLSRFAYIRLDQSSLVIESPLAHARMILHEPRLMSVLGLLATPRKSGELSRAVDNLSLGFANEDVNRFLRLLCEAEFVEQVEKDASDGSAPDADASPLMSWEFHDLLFHSRSRRGRTDGQFGGTYRFSNQAAPSAFKRASDAEPFDLDRPDLSKLERDDPPFAQVQERRRSIRNYGTEPITVGQLGEFLYRVARVKEVIDTTSLPISDSQPLQIAPRPYPSGGGLYELEFYVAIKLCEGLDAGLYHYDPLHHRLNRVNLSTLAVAPLLAEGAMSAGMAVERLQVMIILTSRFQRIAWKYESIAYALTLKHVGVVYQTMYLAATAMGLAPCALGCGDSDLFASVAGTGYFDETSVGEFLLGSNVSEAQ